MLSYSDFTKYKNWWKRCAPETPGFHRSFMAETPLGDIIQAELNFHDKLVKLSLEISRERGKKYIATIKNGSIIKEKDLTSGRNLPLYNKFYPYRDLISCIPESDFIEAIAGAYDIIKPEFPENDSNPGVFTSTKYDHIFGIRRETFLQKFFRERREKKLREKLERGSLLFRIKRRILDEISDIVFGVAISTGFYFQYFDYVILGLALGTMGILTGGLDWWLRKRDPLLTKVLLFLIAGSYFFYNGYTRF